MADSVWAADLAGVRGDAPLRHTALVRVTHWLTAVAFAALLVTGVEIVISHPRFYWGETGNSLTSPLFQLPIPASRWHVPTGYGIVLPDQNGWSRALHFQAAWLMALTGLLYVLSGFLSGHFRRRLWVGGGGSESAEYNSAQKGAYMAVIFVFLPLLIWTGLAMSPSFTAAFPWTVEVLGGHQSARTIHFFVAVLLTLFVIGHVFMVWRNGFVSLTRAMVTGRMRSNGGKP